jgi:hypothetical protein
MDAAEGTSLDGLGLGTGVMIWTPPKERVCAKKFQLKQYASHN